MRNQITVLKNQYLYLGLGLGLGLLTSGCATRFNSDEQLVLISTKPDGAKAIVDDRYVLTTPGRVNLHRLGEHTIVIEKDGYEREIITTERAMSKLVFLDAFCIPFWWHCIERDLKQGGWYRFQDEYHVTLTRLPGSENTKESDAAQSAAPATPPASLVSPQQ